MDRKINKKSNLLQKNTLDAIIGMCKLSGYIFNICDIYFMKYISYSNIPLNDIQDKPQTVNKQMNENIVKKLDVQIIQNQKKTRCGKRTKYRLLGACEYHRKLHKACRENCKDRIKITK